MGVDFYLHYSMALVWKRAEILHFEVRGMKTSLPLSRVLYLSASTGISMQMVCWECPQLS